MQKKKKKSIDVAVRIPTGYLNFRLLEGVQIAIFAIERIINYLIMEEEFIQNQEKLMPHDETEEKELNQIYKGENRNVVLRTY